MSTEYPAQASSPYIACGLIRAPSPPALAEKVQSLDTTLRIVRLGGYGYFFFTAPSYVDLAVNEEMVGIKLGLVRAGDEITSTSTILDRGLITPFGAQHGDIHGNALLLCFSKHEPRFCAYKSLLAVPQLYYWVKEGHILCTDNLRVMAELLDDPQLDPAALPLHFLFRSVPGRRTYLRDVYRLCPGEVLKWYDHTLSIELCRDLRVLSSGDGYQHVEPATVDHFYEQLRWVAGVYLKGINDDGCQSAVLLSGGVDSSPLQLAFNTHLISRPRPLSFSYVSDAPSFAPEIGYAKVASRLLGTKHTFVRVPSTHYPELLVTAIRMLGQPPHHEQMPYMIPLVKCISTHQEGLRYLFSGAAADALHGLPIARDIYRGEKYRNWPVPLLRLLGRVLEPIWQTKAYGARRAADLIPHLNISDSQRHPMNAQSAYTDWEAVSRCFGPLAVREALAYRRELERRYFDSSCLIEKVHILHLLSDTYDTTALWRQLGLACEREIIFPYLDDSVLAATMAFDPRERFFFAGRTKPVLKLALEARMPSDVVNRPKYGGGFGDDLPGWMRHGVLCDMVHAIDRPAFMERTAFECKIEQPDWFTWNLLTFDLFNKYVLALAGENLARVALLSTNPSRRRRMASISCDQEVEPEQA